jgi:ribosomal protein S8
LKYGPNGEKVITGVERISRPGRRVYFRSTEVPPVLGGLGTSIPDDVARRHDRARRDARRRRRRSAV